MSDIGESHLRELAGLINARLDEFKLGTMPALSLGVVRAAHDVIKKWYQEKEEPWAMQRISEVTITAEMAMKLSEQGYEVGHAAAERELEIPVPAPTNGDNRHRDEAEDKRLGLDFVAVADNPRAYAPIPTDATIASGASSNPPSNGGYWLQTPEGSRIHVAGEAADPPPSEDSITIAVDAKIEPLPELNDPSGFKPIGMGRTLAEVDAAPTAARSELAVARMSKEAKAAQLREIIGVLQDIADEGVMPSMAEWNDKKPAHLPMAAAIDHSHDLTWRLLGDYAKLEMGKHGPGPRIPTGTPTPRPHDGGGGMDE